ncbi:PTS sugar transporter subunit IIA [Vagococcus sp. DIV0080]|uniref:PTS sugar transporter subunit IIA n=1 Tax=Candidatus Vagococcus giribetii TaxID=2230876 RepID=A0ABS3HVI1_9ENTE|nr:PTS sugar transporter subunit IIA [Vagococcus sp. DIV0080]MBO0477763.1 PTS sugar transporter subunit IIA [Vagococcus sp. DIV0080]
MINAVITGHGEYSLGMLNALEMIAGEQEKIKAVTFLNDEAMETYQEKLLEAINEVTEEGSDIIIFTDLKGGTPFNVSMLLTNSMPHVKVLAGSNLPIILEFVGQRYMEQSIDQALETLLETGKSGLMVGELVTNTKENEEDGI